MLKVSGLKVSRGRFDLDLNELEFKPGSLNMIIGPNGGGKTTFLKSMAGLLDYKGSISVNGTTVEGSSFKERSKIFGYVPQGLNLSEVYVKDFLILGRFPHTGIFSRYNKYDREKVNKVAEDLNLKDYLLRDITTLSQGELQRVLLAKVFVQEPKILLLDEPTASLDLGFKEIIKSHVYKYLEINKDCLAILSTHEPDIFAERTDKVFMLKNGKLFASGKYGEIYDKEHIKTLFDLAPCSYRS